jgi:glycosyltransferase involved in cell wall biosynthesis
LKSDLDVDATVISNGIEVERFIEAEPIDREWPYLLTVGRLEEYKGVQNVIRSMVEIPEYDLLVAGSGPYRKQLKQIARKAGVSEQVEFLGYVSDEELPKLYAGAEVYVTMSEFESYGTTVAEALGAGTPCLVRDTAGLGDWTESPGVVALSDVSPEVIAEAIRHIAESESQQYIHDSWSDIVNKLAQATYNPV